MFGNNMNSKEQQDGIVLIEGFDAASVRFVRLSLI
jgi:hypothetical protein